MTGYLRRLSFYMSNKQRNIDILIKIINYCDEIKDIHARFNEDSSLFVTDVVYHNSVALSLLQIGELVNHLPDTFRETYNEVSWRGIRGLRNMIAHQYGQIDFRMLWDTSTIKVEELHEKCLKIVERYNQLQMPADDIEYDDEDDYEL